MDKKPCIFYAFPEYLLLVDFFMWIICGCKHINDGWNISQETGRKRKNN